MYKKSKFFLKTISKKPHVNKPKFLGYTAVTSGAVFQNGILTRIVEEVKSKFLDGEVHSVSFQELLELASLKDINSTIKEWLIREGLPKCLQIKIETLDETVSDEDTRYIYNPPLKCYNKDTLLQLLKKRDQESRGTFEDDILASVPHAERVLKCLEEEGKIFSILRSDKKKSYFYKGDDYDPEKELSKPYRKLFRDALIRGYDDAKIEDELLQNNIKSTGNCSIVLKKPTTATKTRSKLPTSSSSTVKFNHNQHVEGLIHFDM